jgi:hypothetical protein
MSLFKEKVIKDYILLLLCLFVQYVYCCLAGCENKNPAERGWAFLRDYMRSVPLCWHWSVLISTQSCRCSSS